MDIETLGWVKASEYRQQVLQQLHEEEMLMPSELADRTGYRPSHVSNTLADLQDRGLVECLTPDLEKGRLYSLTPEGEEIVQRL